MALATRDGGWVGLRTKRAVMEGPRVTSRGGREGQEGREGRGGANRTGQHGGVTGKEPGTGGRGKQGGKGQNKAGMAGRVSGGKKERHKERDNELKHRQRQRNCD